MTVPEALLSFAVVAGLLTIIPGLDTALILRSALTRGRVHAIASALGVCSGCLVWGIAAAVGASALLAASETAYRILTIAGALYMVGLGFWMLWSSFRRKAPSGPAPVIAGGSPWSAWLVGAGTNLLNPKVGAFYLASIPLFIPADSSPLVMGILLALVHNVIGLAWFAIIIGATGFAARWLKGPATARVVDGVTGVVLVGFGVRLAVQPL